MSEQDRERSGAMALRELDAIYEHGVFRPTDPKQVELEEGQRVRLLIEPEAPVEAILELAAAVYAELDTQEIAELEVIMERGDFFGESFTS